MCTFACTDSCYWDIDLEETLEDSQGLPEG